MPSHQRGCHIDNYNLRVPLPPTVTANKAKLARVWHQHGLTVEEIAYELELPIRDVLRVVVFQVVDNLCTTATSPPPKGASHQNQAKVQPG